MSEQPFKLVITGAFNTGKTTFVRSLSEIDVIDTDKATSSPGEQKIKASTTVAMDWGRLQLDDHKIQLFGTPGQGRFDFMREILAKDMNGFLVLVDQTAPDTIDAAAALLAQFNELGGSVPFAVVANKSDLGGGSHDELRGQLGLAGDVPVYDCVATDPDSVRNVLRQFLRATRA